MSVELVPFSIQHFEILRKWFRDDPTLLKLTGTEEIEFEEPEDDNNHHFAIILQDRVIGDINLFVQDSVGEINILIGSKKDRGNGYASLAIKKLFDRNLAKSYTAKISSANKASLEFFLKLGFEYEKYSKVLDEHTLIYHCP